MARACAVDLDQAERIDGIVQFGVTYDGLAEADQRVAWVLDMTAGDSVL